MAKVQKMVFLDADLVEKALLLGDGNFTEGVRKAIREAEVSSKINSEDSLEEFVETHLKAMTHPTLLPVDRRTSRGRQLFDRYSKEYDEKMEALKG